MSERSAVLPMARVGQRLRALRVAREMSQTEVGDAAGLTMQQVSQIELSKRGLGLPEFVAVCRALRSDPRDVLTDEPLPVAWV